MDQKLRQTLALALSIYLISSLISMAAMSVGVGILVLGVILYRKSVFRPASMLVDEMNYPPIRNYFIVSIVMVATILLSLAVSYFSPIEIAGQSVPLKISDEFKKFTKLWYLFLPILLSATLRALTEKERATAVHRWIVMGAIIAIVGFSEHFTGWPRYRIIATSPQFWHTQAFFGFHLSYASIMIFPLFAMIDQFMNRSQNRFSPLITTVLALTSVSALLFTYSRTLWVALPAGILLYGILRLPKKSLAVFTVVAILSTVVFFRSDTVRHRFMERGVTERTDLWSAHLEFVKRRPLTGVGWRRNGELTSIYFAENFPNEPEKLSSHAHSNFLEVLAGTGILGLCAWIFWWVFIITACIKLLKDPERPDWAFPAGLLAAFLVFHVNGLTQVNFWEGKVIHQLMIAVGFILYWSSIHHESRV